jgi:hypothetical protein
MRIACCVVLVAAAACDQGKKSDKPIRPIPVGPYVVHYDCFHSNEPFGKGSQYRNATYDLGAKTFSSQAWELKGEVGEPNVPPAPTVTPLDPSRTAQILAAVQEVLRGGPYKPEYPVPEGTPCTLKIVADGREVFTLEKAATENKDAVSDLLHAF